MTISGTITANKIKRIEDASSLAVDKDVILTQIANPI